MQLSRERWLELAADHGTPHVTLTMPLGHEAITDDKNRLQWKNLVAEAERQLERFGMSSEARQTLLAPARGVLDRERVGASGARGLAMLLARDEQVVHWCEHPLKIAARVSDRFDLSPLLDHLLPELTCHVLALSDRGARLLRCTEHELDEVLLPSAPPSIEAVTLLEDPDQKRPRQAHKASSRGGRADLFTQGFGEEDRRHDQLETWLRAVHQAIRQDLGALPVPLVLACTERAHAMWRNLFGGASCVEGYVHGNPDVSNETEMRASALALVRDTLEPDAAPWIDRYFAARRQGKAAVDLEEVLRAATDQRIDTLFVRTEPGTFGRLLDDGRVLPLSEDAPGAVDLSAQAVTLALLNGGRVMEVDELPDPADGSICNAILRW